LTKRVPKLQRSSAVSRPDAVRPRVFLSHSGYSGEIKRVLVQIEKQLVKAGYEPLIDRQIAFGTEHQREIDRFIEDCDAAVFVISRRALDPKHTWVISEANQLRYKLKAPGFQGIPVLIDKLQPEDLDERWEATRLRLRNAIVGGKPNTIAKKIVNGLKNTHDLVQAQASPVAEALGRKLKEVNDPDALRDAARPLGHGLPEPVHMHLALRLLSASEEHIVTVARALASKSEGAARAVLKLALPFTWVDQNAARTLWATITTQRLAALNATQSDTTRCYIVCGADRYPPWQVVNVRSLKGELLETLEADAAEELNWRNGALKDPTPPERTDASVVFAVHCSRLSAAVIDEFDTSTYKLPNLGVVFVAGRQHWASVEALIAERVELLTPELDAEREAAAQLTFDDGLRSVTGFKAADEYYS
jgi:hypothetical protein